MIYNLKATCLDHLQEVVSCGLPLFPFLFTVGNLYINVSLLEGYKRKCAAIILLCAWRHAYWCQKSCLCVNDWHPAVEKIAAAEVEKSFKLSDISNHHFCEYRASWCLRSQYWWLWAFLLKPTLSSLCDRDQIRNNSTKHSAITGYVILHQEAENMWAIKSFPVKNDASFMFQATDS